MQTGGHFVRFLISEELFSSSLICSPTTLALEEISTTTGMSPDCYYSEEQVRRNFNNIERMYAGFKCGR